MKLFKSIAILAFVLMLCSMSAQSFDNKLIQKGWNELVKDNENEAFKCFWEANEMAKKQNNTKQHKHAKHTTHKHTTAHTTTTNQKHANKHDTTKHKQ